MNEPFDRDRELESVLREVLRDLPPRRAPSSLEARVLARLQDRGFASWRPKLRLSFVLASCVAMAAVLWAGSATLEQASLQMVAVLHLMTAFGVLTDALVALVPTTWLYVGLCIGVSLYAALLCLGATAYHTLFQQPAKSKVIS
jgi:hypothetical protein